MGQYYIIVNLDKKQFIHPHKFGDGIKLLEFADSTPGTMTALAVLLAYLYIIYIIIIYIIINQNKNIFITTS